MPNRAKDWLAQAERDLEQARSSQDEGRHEWACFAAQQAAEKALEQNGKDIGGRALKVNMATEKPSRGRGGRSRW